MHVSPHLSVKFFFHPQNFIFTFILLYLLIVVFPLRSLHYTKNVCSKDKIDVGFFHFIYQSSELWIGTLTPPSQRLSSELFFWVNGIIIANLDIFKNAMFLLIETVNLDVHNTLSLASWSHFKLVSVLFRSYHIFLKLILYTLSVLINFLRK